MANDDNENPKKDINSNEDLAKGPEEIVDSWDGLIAVYKYFKEQSEIKDKNGKRKFKFIFRGQGPHGNLKTSIEQAFDDFEIDINERPGLEKKLIRSFQRKAPYHLKGVGVPALDDTLGWLSLMQHHGAPTRLLDWTYSFYRALYNAISESSHKCKLCGKFESELWVMNTNWFTDETEGNLEKGITGILRDSIEDSSERTPEERQRKIELLAALNNAKKEKADYRGNLANNRNKLVQYLMDLEEPLSLVYNMTPIGLNERVIYQQGTFVLPSDITKCFMQNLKLYGNDYKNHLYKIEINLVLWERNKIIEDLNDMNINEAVLFPGLDGFARSLKMQLAFTHKFGNVENPSKKKTKSK